MFGVVVCCACDVVCDGAQFVIVCFVCGVCGLLFDVVWFVAVWFLVGCDVLRGVVWCVLFVCVPRLCVCVLFVLCCVMVHGLSSSLCACLCLRVLNVSVCFDGGLTYDVV